jgi:hypothetical protein
MHNRYPHTDISLKFANGKSIAEMQVAASALVEVRRRNTVIVKQEFGWGGRIRTFTVLINSEVSYQLDHAPEDRQNIIRLKHLVEIPQVDRSVAVSAGASSGVSWTIRGGSYETFNGGQGVGRSQMGISNGHGYALVT